ncbi:MAG: RNase adapter RapZ [Synergistaceae bacterium]|jgi:UPF0042 nucleotide-binding protein|nr:RNase adapter RapZ [Synergistaceae bacterium]
MARIDRCLLITGMSNAGKSSALRVVEDAGWFAMDNVPSCIFAEIMEALSRSGLVFGTGVAAATDARGGSFPVDFERAVESLEEIIADVRVVFLDASDQCIVNRYGSARRRHPLGRDSTILAGIALERVLMERARTRADIVIDTSLMSPDGLRRSLLSGLGMSDDPVTVIISSFGFKNGIPIDSDYMFDVRFLPNPNYVPELREFSGKNVQIQDYLRLIPEKQSFVEMVDSLLEFVITQYKNTGKKHLHAAVGCTGGRHRSVAVAEELAIRLSERGHRVVTNHRDIDREAV